MPARTGCSTSRVRYGSRGRCFTGSSAYRQFGVNPAKATDKFTVRDFRADCLRELKKNQRRVAGSALSHGYRGVRAFALAATHRAVATAPR